MLLYPLLVTTKQPWLLEGHEEIVRYGWANSHVPTPNPTWEPWTSSNAPVTNSAPQPSARTRFAHTCLRGLTANQQTTEVPDELFMRPNPKISDWSKIRTSKIARVPSARLFRLNCELLCGLNRYLCTNCPLKRKKLAALRLTVSGEKNRIDFS